MPDIINLLPDSVANQIAAGEVIQRPASVIKELVENAVDAGGTAIIINLKDAGRTLIQVIDNGFGMSETDARMAFERHATSKIKVTEDLFEIHTKGFRGEALASIAAVAQVTLLTRRQEDELGTQIEISGSKVESQEVISTTKGSNFLVKNLFFNVPARRKFLKTNSTELRHTIIELHRIALAHAEIEFKLTHNDSIIYNLPVTTLKQRIINVFGKQISQNLTVIKTSTSIISVNGFIGKPEHAKKSMGEQFFFINKRFMKHPYFHKAIMNAYENILNQNSFPSYFIYLETDPKSIDINIHPTKTEIKFENEREIFQIIYASVREALGKFNITPSIDFNNEGIIDIPIITKNTEVIPPEIKIDHEYNPFNEERKYLRNKNYKKEPLPDWEKFYAGFKNPNEHPDSFQITGKSEKEKEPHGIFTASGFMQFKGKYILTSVKSGLLIVDQKRAHERIVFDHFIQILENNQAIAQQSLFREIIELNPADYLIIIENLEDIKKIGFNISDNGDNTIEFKGCPSEIMNPVPKDIIETIIENYKNLDIEFTARAKEKIVISLAKACVISYGKNLQKEEMQKIVDQLFASTNPNYSPTGKKIFSILDLQELENIFN